MKHQGSPIARVACATVAAILVAGSALAGCGTAEAGDELLAGGPAENPQEIDPGTKTWRQVTLVFDPTSPSAPGEPLATVYLFNVAVGSYRTGTEYWFVNEAAIPLLGTRNLTITTTDVARIGRSVPPDPGYAQEQSFTLANETDWGTGWTTDPVSGGVLMEGAGTDGGIIGLRLFSNGAQTSITRVVWYQGGSDSCTVCNLTPEGEMTVTAGAFVPPAGAYGYDISQSPSG